MKTILFMSAFLLVTMTAAAQTPVCNANRVNHASQMVTFFPSTGIQHQQAQCVVPLTPGSSQGEVKPVAYPTKIDDGFRPIVLPSGITIIGVKEANLVQEPNSTL